MDLIQFLTLMNEVSQSKTYYLRWGQTLMNVLYRTYPDLYDMLMDSHTYFYKLDEAQNLLNLQNSP